MAIFKWEEITNTAWVISLSIASLVLWYSWPFIKTVGTLIQLTWVVYTNEWTDGGF